MSDANTRWTRSCGGNWLYCPNVVQTLDKGAPVTRCKLTWKHPDECHHEVRS